MLRYFIVLALFLANVGCGRSVWPAHIKFNSNTMSPDVTFVLTQYVKDLNKLMDQKVLKFDSDTDPDSLRSYTIFVKLALEDVEGNKAGIAEVGPYDCFITIYPLAYRSDIVKTVLWHEIGHCVGLRHIDVGREIMSPGVGHFSSYPEQKIRNFRNDFLLMFRLLQ